MSLRPPQRRSLVSRLFRNSFVESETLQQEDVIIVVMGPTGSGKSTFIETITGIRGIVEHGLKSFTTQIAVYKISFPDLPGSDIHFVDTPGFDDTRVSDVDIFKMISEWLHNTYRKRIQVTGLIYFHRISDNRMAGTALKNLNLFQSLCGEEFNNIVLTTTMWDEVEDYVGYLRERELKNVYWKAMVHRGSSMRRFKRTRQSAFDVLEPIIGGVMRRKALLLQREVEDLGMKLNQTRAGQTLSTQLEDLVGVQEEKLNKIRTELRNPLLTPKELNLLMEEYQKISLDMQRTAKEAERMKTLTTSKAKLRQVFDFMKRKSLSPQSRQDTRNQDGRGGEAIVWQGTSARPSQTPGPSRYGWAVGHPMPVKEEPAPCPPSGQGSPGSYSSHVREPEHMSPTTSSPPLSRAYSLRRETSPKAPKLEGWNEKRGLGAFSAENPTEVDHYPNQFAWDKTSPQTTQHNLPQRTHTILPGSYPSSSSSQSRRPSIPHDNGMGSYQGSSTQLSQDNSPPHNRRRSRSQSGYDGDWAQS